jgi:uncharacterized DUF497 family protein
MRFEWDPRKTAANLLKHGISFEEATTGLRDNLAITGRDPDHSTGETRYITFGVSSQGRLLVVAHTERGAYPLARMEESGREPPNQPLRQRRGAAAL